MTPKQSSPSSSLSRSPSHNEGPGRTPEPSVPVGNVEEVTDHPVVVRHPRRGS